MKPEDLPDAVHVTDRSVCRDGIVDWYVALQASSSERHLDLDVALSRWLAVHPHVRGIRSLEFGPRTGVASPDQWLTLRIPSPGAASILFHGIEGPVPQVVARDGVCISAGFTDTTGRYVWFNGPRPPGGSATDFDHVFEAIGRMAEALGFQYRDLLRTWFFLGDIGCEYASFNGARRRAYMREGIAEGRLPASTGVGVVANARMPLLTTGLFVLPARGVCTVPVESPEQCAPALYGSLFSRAIEIRAPRCRRLLVSGTASIDQRGHSMHARDGHGQVARTAEVVRDVLTVGGMGVHDVVNMVAYVSEPGLVGAAASLLASEGFHGIPLVVVQALICRPELVFEVELEAARVTG